MEPTKNDESSNSHQVSRREILKLGWTTPVVLAIPLTGFQVHEQGSTASTTTPPLSLNDNKVDWDRFEGPQPARKHPNTMRARYAGKTQRKKKPWWWRLLFWI
jgi:hypothetical protein